MIIKWYRNELDKLYEEYRSKMCEIEKQHVKKISKAEQALNTTRYDIEFLVSEEKFIDTVVERIRKKQL